MNDDTTPPTGDQRVIDELERLQEAIKTTRARREQAEAEFAGYLEAFNPASEPAPETETPALVRSQPEAPAPRSPAPSPPTGGRWENMFAEEHAAAPAPPAAAPVRPAPEVGARPAPLKPVVVQGMRRAAEPRAGVPPGAAPPDAPKETPGASADPLGEIMRRLRPPDGEIPAPTVAPTPPPAPARRPTPVIAAAAVLLLVAGVGGWLMFSGGGEPATTGGPVAAADADTTPEPGAASAPPAPAAAAAAPEPAPPAAPLRVVVRTTRHVWLRLIVDGDLRLEKEVPAGERYPLGAQQTVVVRAGDAGAVTVEVDGASAEALGGDGVVLTRRFTAR